MRRISTAEAADLARELGRPMTPTRVAQLCRRGRLRKARQEVARGQRTWTLDEGEWRAFVALPRRPGRRPGSDAAPDGGESAA